MTHTDRRQLQSIIARVAVAALALAGYLAALPAAAGSGDLDPSFADTGRLFAIPGTAGEVHSIEVDGSEGLFVAGGDFDIARNMVRGEVFGCAYSHSNFMGRIDGSGSPVESLASPDPASIDVNAVARDSDGRIVAVGRQVPADTTLSRCSILSKLAVFRLLADGSLDTSFADQGLFFWPDTGSQAHALLVEPDGRIVIAGLQTIIEDEDNSRTALAVFRLLADGSRDPSFATEGVFSGAEIASGTVRALRTGAGDYRVSAQVGESCGILGLKADGTFDAAFGDAGTASVRSMAGDTVACDATDLTANDAMLIAGTSNGHAFLERLLPDGSVDPAFTPAAFVANTMEQLTAVAEDASGRVVVAGMASGRSAIVRLAPSGALDAAFGEGGRTWIDLPSADASMPHVLGLLVRDDGSVIAAGGDAVSDESFVARLLGDAAGDSPGVVGYSESAPQLTEVDGQMMLRVRRTGGRDGEVSVTYRTLATGNAVAGEDFMAAEGTLHWADGDTSEKEFAVTLIQDDEFPELEESFAVDLVDAAGGAGLGTYRATVTVLPDGSPGGQVQMESAMSEGGEGAVAYIVLTRNFYAAGRVCVKFTAKSGTAAEGKDFKSTSSLACWEDQQVGGLQFEIPILDDDREEAIETFVVELSDPTGGAIVGAIASTTVSIPANDVGIVSSHGSGGGGPAELFELLTLLGLLLTQRRTAVGRGKGLQPKMR